MALSASVDDLVAYYAATHDAATRAQIVNACTALIELIALRFVAAGHSRDDLVQVGYLGLLSAIETFDPSRGVKFETYARPLIAGEMHHYVRDNHGTIRRPRWLRKLSYQIDQTVDRHLNERRQYPSLRDLASELNITEEGLLEILRTREAVRTTSLDARDEEEEYQVNRRLIRHKVYESFQLPIEDRIVLHDAIERLTLLQRKVLYYIFFLGASQEKTAARIGTNQRRVSRILNATLVELRQSLTQL